MADTYAAPQYAHNSDVEQDASDESDYEHSPEPDTKPVVDPWNDPEDDDDEDDEDESPQKRATSSPDYLGTEKPQESKKRGASAAWDALGDDDGDTTDDDIPPGVSVGGRETKSSSAVKREPSNDIPDARRNGHIESEEPLRKRQRTSQDPTDVKPEPSATTIFKSATGASPRPPAETHAQPLPPPTYVPHGPHHPGMRNPMDRYPPHVPMPGLLMKSFFGITPRDEFVRIIGEWLLQVCRGQRGIEIEIKFGTLLDRGTKRRINIPSLTEMILPDTYDCLFVSEMTPRQHYTLNQFLNKETDFCSGRAGPHPLLPPHTYFPITYKHTYTTDSFFPASQLTSSGAKRRLTVNDKTGQMVECLEKAKLANLNVFSPNEEFDWRISVNSEVPAQVQPHETSTYARRKDRVSYKHSLFQIDLTQVSNPSNPQASQTHELEIEVVNAVDLLTQGWKESQNLENNFEQQLESLLNTTRLLNRNAGPKVSQTQPKGPPAGRMQ